MSAVFQAGNSCPVIVPGIFRMTNGRRGGKLMGRAIYYLPPRLSLAGK
jgi:hypothetical protein